MPQIREEWYDWRGRKHVRIMDEDGIKELIEDSLREDGGKDGHGHHWYQKPIGVISLAVGAGIILILIGAALRHFWPRLFP
jgi:hypothetical protein